MTDLGWGAYVNCKKKLERFLGGDIELEPERKDKKSRKLEIEFEKKDAKIRALQGELVDIGEMLENREKQRQKDFETNNKMLDGLTDMIKDLMGKEHEEQDRIAKSKKSLKKELNIDEMEKALQEQYEELEFD